ncbi:DUF493 family protein YbeD [Gallaecimonas kandeliae]|uniref:DUF493 family protein YbeD n=1 Tax=Gallaecimonas kandeliae TaxID=3029055 RepID=UPI002647475C|nr:DUF493 family protein YbeD [Gallaecimonas kandeliae]WKE66622.1 DUF493 family protein YbeD [Gallaecimonas kandeliae]
MQTEFDKYLEFPCLFPFKVLGAAREDLVDDVLAVVQQHAPGDYSPTVRPSSKGSYHSVTVQVTVTSKDHVETLYKALGAIETVKYVL